jgi:hypothetical protein
MSAKIHMLIASFPARCCIALALLVGWPGSSLLAQERVYDEHSVKAAFIYHFATFVVWPETVRPQADFVVAVLGDDEVAEELEEYLPGHSIQGRPMRARRIDSIEELGDEAVLFIGSGRMDVLARPLGAISDQPVLLVTDGPGALRKGSMINFEIVDGRVRFEIALGTAERAGLNLSSRLLSAAMFVDTTSAVIDPPFRVLASIGHPHRFY